MANETAGRPGNLAPTTSGGIIKRGWARARASWDAIFGRKRAEEALSESEERFRSAFEHAAIGMALVRPDGHRLRVNPSF